jgi:hypothetical protein
MDKCINCQKDLPKKHRHPFCQQCNGLPTFTISNKDALTEYRLTQKEIDDAKLYVIPASSYGHKGRKYMLKEIEELADKIYDALPDDDARKLKNELLDEKKLRKLSVNKLTSKYQRDDKFMLMIKKEVSNYVNCKTDLETAQTNISQMHNTYRKQKSYEVNVHTYIRKCIENKYGGCCQTVLC